MRALLEQVAPVVAVLWALLSVWAVLKRRPALLALLLLVGLGLGNFGHYAAGTIWFPAKITTYVSLVYVAAVDLRWVTALKRGPGVLWWAVAGSVWLAVVAAVVIGPGDAGAGGGLQGAVLRPIVQGVSYAAFLALLPLGWLVLQERSSIDRLMHGYFGAVAVVTGIAVVQFFVVRAGGTFLPILRPGTSHVSEVAAFSVGGAQIPRLYSVAGEPKALAIFLLPALFGQISLLGTRRSEGRPWWARPAFAVLVGVVFLLTFSTAALIAFVLGTALLVLFVFPGVRASPLRTAGFGAVILAASLLVVPASTGGGAASLGEEDLVARTLEARTVGQIDRVQRRELAGLRYVWEERPEALWFGLGPGMYNFHLPDLVHSQGVEPYDSGWVVLLLDLGLVGLSLFAALIAWLLARAVSLLRRRDRARLGFTALAVGGLVGGSVLHLGTGALDVTMLCGGLVLGLCHRSSAGARGQGVSRGHGSGRGSRPIPESGRLA